MAAAGVVAFADARPASAAESDVPGPLADAVSQALADWAAFASTGDLAAIQLGFVQGGPQRRQLEAESVTWTDDGSPEPLRFVIRQLRLRRLGAETATVWAQVEVTRPGFESRRFAWDFDLVLREGRWQVWTVVAAEPPDPAPPVTQAAAETQSTSSSPVATSLPERPPEPTEVATATRAEARSPTPGIRLPVLSAWIIVITIVGVALAGYLAPRIDRRGEG